MELIRAINWWDNNLVRQNYLINKYHISKITDEAILFIYNRENN